MKKVTAVIIGCILSLYSISVSAMDISNGTSPVLTLESAITRAQIYSKELSEIRRKQKLNSAKLNAAASDGSYQNYQKQYLENQYADKQEKVQQEVIAYKVSKLFDEILLNKRKLQDLKDSLIISQRSIEDLKLKLQKGAISQADLDQANLDFERVQNDKSQLEDAVVYQYTLLSKMIGKTTTLFELQKEAVIYKPFEIIGNLDGVMSSKAAQNLEVWKAIELAKIESEIDYSALEKAGNSYVTYLQMQENAAKSQDISETTKEQFENTLRNKYIELVQLQNKYKLQEEELQMLENQCQKKNKQNKILYN